MKLMNQHFTMHTKQSHVKMSFEGKVGKAKNGLTKMSFERRVQRSKERLTKMGLREGVRVTKTIAFRMMIQ
jgi:hypothetical protein